MDNNRIGLGGGCHWCTEAVFQVLKGVQQVEMGYIRSEPPDDFFSEAVLVVFDPDVIALSNIIKVHLDTHSSTANHQMRDRYRSAVYVFGEQQQNEANAIIHNLQAEYHRPLVTRALPFSDFKPAEEK